VDFSDRQLRLFAVACVRRIWHLLSEEASRKVVEVVERYGEGLASDQELMDAYDAANTVTYEANDFIGGDALETWTACAAAGTAYLDVHRIEYSRPQGIDWFDIPLKAAKAAAKAAVLVPNFVTTTETAEEAEAVAQTHLLRCIFGNPFRPVLAINSSVLAWND